MSYLTEFLEWMETQDKEKLFKTTLGRFRTQSLFLELTRKNLDELPPIFTTKARHHRDYWSFPLLYLELADPTEYLVGDKLLYNYQHWCRLVGARGFRTTLEKIRTELELKMRADALQNIQNLSRDPKRGSTSLAASKLLLDRGWMSNEEKKSKLAVKRDAKFKEIVEDELNEDFKLIEILNGQASAN